MQPTENDEIETNAEWIYRTRVADIWLKENFNWITDRWATIYIVDKIEILYIYPPIEAELSLNQIDLLVDLLCTTHIKIECSSSALALKIKYFSLTKLKSYLLFHQIQMNDYSEDFIDNLLKKTGAL